LAGGIFGIDIAAGVPACSDQDNDLVSLPDSAMFSPISHPIVAEDVEKYHVPYKS